MACTTILVGKNASYDGSTIIARNEDSPRGEFTEKRMIVVKSEDQPTEYKAKISHLTVDLTPGKNGLPAPMQYTAVPDAVNRQGIWGEHGVNEANVAMSETETLTSNERVLGADPLVELKPAKGKPGEEGYEPEVPGGIGEEDFLTLVLPYVRTAREGVLRLGALLEQFGTYEMNGVAFSDLDEIWWLETVGGHHWIAKRVPDDCYVTMPNQLGIDEFDLEDALGERENHMCSADLREFIEENHLNLAVENVSDLNPRDMFGSHSDSDHVYNTPRAWYMQRFLNPYDEMWDSPSAPHTPFSDDIPWARQPERKITIEDVKYVLSSHYQGTKFDPYGNEGDENTRGSVRCIGVNRNNHLCAIQLRPYVPGATCAIQWLAYGSNVFNTLVPVFANVNDIPQYYRDTTGTVDSNNFYWANRLIGALADAQFADNNAHIERYQQKTGSLGVKMIISTDKKIALLAENDKDFADSLETVENSCVREILQQANARLADEIHAETNDVLGKVLYVTSMGMKNDFHMSDN